jgi:uncharacterized repeat protein (TIGR03806 family)
MTHTVEHREHVVRPIPWGIAILASCIGGAGCHSSSDNGEQQAPPTPTGGLDSRPSNVTCVAPSKTTGAGTTVAVQRVFPGLTFDQPLLMLQAPGDSSRWYVLERAMNSNANAARVRVFANTPNVSTASTAITLTVNSNGEGGLLGMAFHPSYGTNHQVYLSFTESAPTASGLASRVARFTTADGGATFDPATRLPIISLNQPYTNHNGGNIAFGPDSFLYIGFGDGGSGGDPQGHAQNTKDLLGDMLRLDVDHGTPYAIPSGSTGNPFAGNPTCPADYNTGTQDCPEIYAWGLRNPWRWSFDSLTGDLWVGDVGQNLYEEIDRVQRRGNYGWNCREGKHAYNASCASAPGFIEPVVEYDHSQGNSVTGGYVYRGAALPALVGHYVFGDYGSGRIWRLDDNGSGGYTAVELADTGLAISSFGQGNDGELYVVDIGGGGLYELVDGGGGAAGGPPVATQLSATGCVAASNPSQPAAGLIPYDVAAPFWSDGAAKERWLAIPNGTSISVGTDGDFAFPNGTVLMKHFRLNGNLVETRLFMRHPDGDWAGYTYEWNAQHTDATLVQGGKTVAIGAQNWIFPSGNDCLTCHTSAAGFALGLESAQLNHDFTYASTGRTANELRTLDDIVMFTTPLGDPALQPVLPDPFGSAPLPQRARAYLHTNCSQCHRPGGPTGSSMDLRYSTLLANTGACDAMPQSGDLGIGVAARIIAPGSAANSVLLARINRRDASQMPPLATNVIDSAGVTLIRDWITSLTTCQ